MKKQDFGTHASYGGTGRYGKRKEVHAMEFRPCIDIHNGKVKQIVGGSLRDAGDQARENFISQQDGAFYAEFYKKDNIRGGHIILLNPETSQYYEETKRQALLALAAYPQGLQVGGGIRDDNARFWIENGASHVIVTSFVFRDGKLNYENLLKMTATVTKERLVLDLSCRKKKDGRYYIVTDRWQKFTEVVLTPQVLDELSAYCDEFLIHAVDVEGKASGIETELVQMLGDWDGIPVTYAGGVGSYDDLEKLKKYGKGKVNVTVGSALDLFGGGMEYRKVLEFCRKIPENK